MATPAGAGSDGAAASTAPPLFGGGLGGGAVGEFRRRAGELAAAVVLPRLADAERRGRFPAALLREVGRAGFFAERWTSGSHGDPGRAVVLAEELGRAGCGSLAVGLTIHGEAVISILRRFGRGRGGADHLRRALAGTALGCVALTEEASGSDLAGVAMQAARVPGGWRLCGEKKFVSLATSADFALVLCRLSGREAEQAIHPLLMAIVPRDQFQVLHPWRTLGLRGLGTASIGIDALVPDDRVLGRPGTGLLVATWGLTHERLATAAALLGSASLALRLATEQSFQRRRFGARLFDHQAVRLRLACCAAELTMVRLALYAAATSFGVEGLAGAREIAGLKATTAGIAQRVVDESLQVFGGDGYLEEAGSQLGRLWRDVRFGRIGGGTDEMMWELAAGGLGRAEDAAGAGESAPG